MADQRTMANCYVHPPILAEQFELKRSLINMMTSDQFFRLEKDNPHDHIRAARRWLEKEPPHSILTWEDLVSKFINEFFPPSRTTNLRNEISNFQQRFDESFHEAWDRYNDLLRACPHHGLTESHQPDTFYNDLNPPNQDSLNSAAGGNLLERRTQDVLTIIKNKSKVRNFRNKSVVSQVKSSDANSNPSSEIAKLSHAVNHGNTFPKLRDNIQGYVAAAAINYNQGDFDYCPSGSRHLPSNTIANPKGELKSITTQSGIVLDGTSVPISPLFINPEEDERVEETLTDQDLAEYTIKQEKDEVQIHKFWQMFKQLHINITLADALILITKYQKILKALLSNKEKLLKLANTPLNENYSAVILKKLPEKLGEPGKFLILCGFSELKCKALADLAGIARDVFASVGKFTFSADFVIVDYESYPRVPLILGKPFLWTARALIDVHGEEMILRDGDERLTLNMRHDTSSYSNQPQKESINMINIYDDSGENFLENLFSTNHQSGNPTFSSQPILTSPEVKDDVFDPEGGNVLPEKLLDLDSTKDLHPPHHINPLSGSTTCSSPNHLLEEFTDELALITFPPRNDDLPLKDLIDQINLDDLNDNLIDTMPEMFTDEHALDYSSSPLYDEYDDDLFEAEFDIEYVYNDPFDSKGKKIKESKLLIDELDLPSDFLPSFEYDLFLFKDFFEVDALPSTNNEEKVFNPGILIRENLFEVITRIAPDKKPAISHAFLILEDFDPPLYELPLLKEVPRSKTLLLFSSENEEKVFNPGILTSKEVHYSLISKLSYRGYKVFKIIKILKSSIEIFLFSRGKDIHILDVPCLYFYPP
nr:reverse transcriptase domain-containing protein [Tanacetum cinerariifolium]